MGDISRYFDRSEFRCKCQDNCGFDTVDAVLLKWLENIREHFNKPVIIHCGCRCKKHNKAVGSKNTSQHLKAKAADFHISGVEPEKIAYYAGEFMGETGGIGIYDWGCHIDSRTLMARWDERNA